MIKKEIIQAYALDNAIAHNGKANPGAVINSLFVEGLKKEEIKDVSREVQKIIEEVNSWTTEKRAEEFEKLKKYVKKRKQREGLPELPNVQAKVILRIAPYPSGPLHIGNARQLILNDEYAKIYNGNLIFVIDDTIGSEKKPIEPSAYKLIEEGSDWLKIKHENKIVLKSDRLKIYYDYAEQLIKLGHLYVCSCSAEKIREMREKGEECECRNLPIDEQLKRWKKMFESKAGEFTVRLKTSMSHENPAFRDRVMFRISEREHPKVKHKYKVWPLLEFSWAIDDHLLEITHIIRGMDLLMETKVEEFIWELFSWEKPKVIHTGLLAIEGVKISKSKGAQEVRSGKYIGWNDPRTWSLQSLKDRGFFPEAIREFFISIGMTKKNSKIPIDVLYAINRKYLEKAPRYFFVPNPSKIKISGCPELEAKIPLHPNEKLGERKYRTSQEFCIPEEDLENMEDGNYRLMHLLNFKTDHQVVTKPRDFHFISSDPDDSLGVKFIQWLPVNEDNINVSIRMPDGSITAGLGEPELLKLKTGTQIQFERFGFVKLYKLDKKNNQAEFWFTHI
ncbi:MAG: glutamate--tRNA ligase [Nanoarchaeota archaeon]